MTKREKVVDDLEEQIAWIRDNDFHKFPGWGHAVLAMRDAIALLKAQEPRVMTLEELIGIYNFRENHSWVYDTPPYLYLDNRAWIGYWVSWSNIVGCLEGQEAGYKVEKYGERWRCWTSRPTDEQRETVKWELPTTKRP